MILGESSDSDGSERAGICMEISNPNPMVLPVPQNRKSAYCPMQIWIRLTNNTPTPFYYRPYGTFIPELVGANGQTLQRKIGIDESDASRKTNISLFQRLRMVLKGLISKLASHTEASETKKCDYWPAMPGVPNSLLMNAQFCWRDKLLLLKLPTIPEYLQVSSRPNKFWYFDAIAPGYYQLRFIYDPDGGTRSESVPDTKEVITVPERGAQQLEKLATPFVNIHLVQPVETDSSPIEVDGVRFKIEMPETVLTIPANPLGGKTPVRLGIRVTNNTSIPLRFERLNSVYPTLIASDSKALEPDSDLMRLWVAYGPPYYSAMPGESAFFVLDGTLLRHFNKLQLAIPNEAGGFWYFRSLKLGTYQLRFVCEVAAPIPTNKPEEEGVENVWNGWIALPFVEFRIASN